MFAVDPQDGDEQHSLCSAAAQVVVENEETDAFPITDASPIILDCESMAVCMANQRQGPASVATTDLASAVGSTIRPPPDAFIKSLQGSTRRFGLGY